MGIELVRVIQVVGRDVGVRAGFLVPRSGREGVTKGSRLWDPTELEMV